MAETGTGRNTQHRDPHISLSNGKRSYVAAFDPENLRLVPVNDLISTIEEKAEHWAMYSGPGGKKRQMSETFGPVKTALAHAICHFLDSKTIRCAYLVQGLDTFYSIGGDHCGDDIMVETVAGLYVIHFGFST